MYNCLINYVKFDETVQKPKSAAYHFSLPTLTWREQKSNSSLWRSEKILRSFLSGVESLFDIIFLDCPPALGILTVNALVAARSVLIPVQCEYYAMEGLSRLIGSIERIQQSWNPGLTIEGIVLTMYDPRNTLARQVAEQVRGHFKDLVYQTTIPRNVTLAEAPSYGRPVLLYNMASAGAQAYQSLAKEFINHGEKGPR